MPAIVIKVVRNPYHLIELAPDAVVGAGPRPRLRGTGGTDLLRLDRNMLTVNKLRVLASSFVVRNG